MNLVKRWVACGLPVRPPVNAFSVAMELSLTAGRRT